MRRTFFILMIALTLPVMVSGQALTRLASSPQTAGTMTTSGDVIDFPIPIGIGYGSLGVEARGTWTGTVAVQCIASQGGGTYAALILSPRASTTTVTSFTANGQWSTSIVGCQKVRATATAAMTGTVTITMIASFAGGGSGAGGGGGSGCAGTAGTPCVVEGNGTDGVPAGGVLSVQSPSGGFAKDATVDTVPATATGPYILCYGASAAPTVVTTGRPQYVRCNLNGELYVAPAPGTLVSGAVTSAMTGTTTTSVVAGTASNYLYITSCVVSNASLTVSTDILLQDGSGGTTLYVLPAPAAATATTGGSGATHTFGSAPLKVPTSGNALFAANVTTSSSTKISCNGFRSTVSY